MFVFIIYRYRLRFLRMNLIWLLRGIIKKYFNVILYLGVLKIVDKLNWLWLKLLIWWFVWDMIFKVVGWKL